MAKRSFALLLLVLVWSAQAQTPHVRVEATDAYVVSRADQKPSGPALDLSEALLRRAGLDYSVEVAPWARCYSAASRESGVLLFTLGRTPQREAHFHWIGPTFPLEYRAYRLKERSDVVVNSVDDLRRYRISVVRDSAIVPWLRQLQLPEDRIDRGLQFIPAAGDHWPKLERNHVDLFIATSRAVQTMCLRGDYDCNRLVSAWTFPQPRLMAWIALSEMTPADVVARVGRAYHELKQSGEVDHLLGPAPSDGPH